MTTRDEYNEIKQAYEESKERPTSKYVLIPSFVSALGDIKGLDVLDVACGSGYSTRLVKRYGANRIVGVDISDEQIEMAIEKETQRGIDYFVADVINDDLTYHGEFDMVTAMMLLHYSKTKKEIDKMLNNIFSVLKPGGIYLNIMSNNTNYEQYGVRATAESEEEGAKVTIELCSVDFTKKFCEFTSYYWEKQTYEEAFRKAGFEFEEVPIIVAGGGAQQPVDAAFREAMEKNPFFMIHRLRK